MTNIRTPSTLSKEEYLELPPHERGKYLREIIRKTLEQNEQGVSVSDLEENLPFDKRAIQKHLEVLTHTNVAYTSKVGPTKLYHPNERALHTGIEKEFTINGKEYGIYTVDNRLGEFVLIQESKNDEVEGGVLVPLSGFDEFIKNINEVAEEIDNG
jgi:DNA-binding transcriptional ArsR family regulator